MVGLALARLFSNLQNRKYYAEGNKIAIVGNLQAAFVTNCEIRPT